MPMFPVLPVMRLWAAGFGWYPSSRAAARTRSRVVPRTWWDALRARDTVDAETFALRATSWIVTGTGPLQLLSLRFLQPFVERVNRQAAGPVNPFIG
jgi:hypothetical protein